MDTKHWVYVFVRTDIPLSQQIVQASHATLEVGLKDNNKYTTPSSIVLIQIKNEQDLQSAMKDVQSLGIEYESFYEPYEDMGITAFATMPVTEDKRELFKSYTLWGRSVKGVKTPLTEFLKEEMKENQRKKKMSLELDLKSFTVPSLSESHHKKHTEQSIYN